MGRWYRQQGWGTGHPLPETFPVHRSPSTLVDIALKGYILTFPQGPPASSVLGRGCCQVSCAGTTRTAFLALQRPRRAPRSRGPAGFGAHISQCSPECGCTRHWAGNVTKEGSSLTRPPLLCWLLLLLGLVARQGIISLGPPRPWAPENPGSLAGQYPFYGRGFSLPDG